MIVKRAKKDTNDEGDGRVSRHVGATGGAPKPLQQGQPKSAGDQADEMLLRKPPALQKILALQAIFRAEMRAISEKLAALESGITVVEEQLGGLNARLEGVSERVQVVAASNAALTNASNEMSRMGNQFFEKRVMEPMVRSLFSLYDLLLATQAELQDEPGPAQETVAASLALLEEFLAIHTIEAYSHPVGARYEAALMQAVQSVETHTAHLDMTVAQSLRCGFRGDDRVYRQESVVILKSKQRKPGARYMGGHHNEETK